MAPPSLVSMFLAPVAGRLSDKVGGKYILMTGLALYGLGMAWIVAIAQWNTSWPAFLPAFVVAGVGIGGVFAPMATEAMRNVDPRMAGAASGVNNTIRQIGSVIGTAAMGAVLQNRLSTSLPHEAAAHAGQVPAAARGPFVESFRNAAKGGLEVGAGQSGAAQNLPKNLPANVADQIATVAKEVFARGYVTAMKPTMALPIAVVLVAAASCFAMKRYRRSGDPQTSEPVEAAA
jgi:MFS family permease